MSDDKLPEPLMRNGLPLHTREATVVVRAAADDLPEMVEVSLSSETPVLRYDWRADKMYYEVLAHDEAAVDLSRAANGLPFLAEHWRTDLIGRLTNLRVENGRLVGALRFSQREDAQGIVTDIRTGIRPDVSIGYFVGDEYTEEQREGDKYPTRRYLRWTPYEGSSVSIPADFAVGIGRSAHAAHNTPKAETRPEVRMDNTEKGAAAAVVAEPGAEARFNQIAEMVRHAEIPGDKFALAREYASSGKSIPEIGVELIRKVAEGQTTAPSAVKVELNDKEQRRFSLVRALGQLERGQRAGFEFEVSDEVAKQLRRETQGIFLPTSLYAQNPDAAPSHRTLLSVGNKANTKGGEGVFTEYANFVDFLRARSVTAAMGANVLGGLQGDIGFPGQTAPGTLSWGNETTNASLSSLSTNLRTMAPRVAQSATSMTRQILRQASFDVENLVRNDILQIHALGIDFAAIHGTGTGGQPRGITNTVGIGAVTAGANGAQPTYDHIVDLQREVAIDNALAGTLGYVVHPLIAARLMKTQQFASTNGTAVWTGSMLDGQLGGFRAIASTQVLSGQTVGTSTDCSPIIFGDWSSLYIGEWGSLEVIPDFVTIGPTQIKLMSIQMVDVFLRYPEKFAVFAGARI